MHRRAAAEYEVVLPCFECGLAAEAKLVHERPVRREARGGGLGADRDLLLTPTMNTPALPLGRLDANADLAAAEWTTQLFDACSFAPLFNQTGAPAISLPLGESSQGLPIGVQLSEPVCAESLLLRVAAFLEEAMPWAARRPAVHAAATGNGRS